MSKLLYLAFFSLLFSPLCTSNNLPPDSSADVHNVMPQQATLPPLPQKVDFAGEQVPLAYFDVRESLMRELTVLCYWHASMLNTMSLANRYFPIIEPILKREGVPDDFKYLCVAESNLQQVISPMKAVGLWQFLESTAKEYKLEVNNEIDERYHVEKSTVAACQYLKKSYQKYGNWALAGASYNIGNNNVDKQISRQNQVSYYDLLLPEETSRYIFRAVAFKLIMSDPAGYGYNLNKEDLARPFEWTEKEVAGSVASWAEFAAEHGTTYKILKYFNPWLREVSLTNKNGKTYRVKIPKTGFRE